MRILALVPPSRSATEPSRYSFLNEELKAFADRGLEIHSVSYEVQEKVSVDRITLHPIARRRQMPDSLRSLRWITRLPVGISRLRNRLDLCRTYQAIAKVIFDERIDLIYSPFAWPLQSAAIPVAAASGIPVVVSLRGADVLVEPSVGYGRTLDPLARARISNTLRSADHVIGISKALVDRGVELGADPERCSVVLKGVDEQRFSPGDSAACKHRLGLDGDVVILFAGNLIRLKGVDILLKSLAAVRGCVANATVVVCGDGAEMQTLRTLARQEKIEPFVRFVGRVGRQLIPDYFRACDVFVLPSLSEGAGNVLVEAGACGKPAVGTSVAGIPDYIDDGVTGFLFQKADPADLAKKLIAVLTDPKRAEQMGAAARQRVLQHHTYDQMVKELLSIFQRVAENRRLRQTVA